MAEFRGSVEAHGLFGKARFQVWMDGPGGPAGTELRTRKDEANSEKELMFLIESLAGEDDATFAAAVDEMIRQSYGQRPEWLEFEVGARWEVGGQVFREFRCAAGSVSLFLMREARSERGFERRIIYAADVDAETQAYVIAGGVETDFPSKELTEA